ncbi:MAG TPA: hypothetical protein VMT30_06220 [Candidatus Saccharimonadia bacterium]|nr:hypothetical protein [Candidatus Saccharimonadia bacterium]
MNDRTLQRKLNQLAKLANKIEDEAKRRYGPDGFLFFEAEGTFYVMDGDARDDESIIERQKHIRMHSAKYCRMGAGAW